MALVDVTELLSDPDFIDPVAIIHRTSYVNNLGENQLLENSVSTIGSVQPISGKDLQRLPEDLRIAGVNTFWVKGAITSDGRTLYPDILVFRGLRYQVKSILDWTNWGAGYSEGVCVREAVAL